MSFLERFKGKFTHLNKLGIYNNLELSNVPIEKNYYSPAFKNSKKIHSTKQKPSNLYNDEYYCKKNESGSFFPRLETNLYLNKRNFLPIVEKESKNKNCLSVTNSLEKLPEIQLQKNKENGTNKHIILKFKNNLKIKSRENQIKTQKTITQLSPLSTKKYVILSENSNRNSSIHLSRIDSNLSSKKKATPA